MHIWLISAFEPTPADNTRPMRFMGIADAAIQRGHKVTFFTTTFKHSNKTQRYNKTTYEVVKEGVYELVFVHSKSYQKNISIKRMLAHYDLADHLMIEIKKQKEKPDAIFISLPPLSTVSKVCRWARSNSIPVIVDIIDPWPEVFIKAFPSKIQKLVKLALQPFYNKFQNIIKHSSGVTAISEQYIKWAEQFGLNGKPKAFFYPAIQFDHINQVFQRFEKEGITKGKKLRIIYAGSLSSSYDIPTILSAAELIQKKYPDETEFAIAGTGPQEELIKQTKGSNVVYLGWLGQEEIYKEFYLSHLGLTQHVKGATQSVTYKLFDYLSAGLPVLNSLESEMADIIIKNKVGFHNKSGDAKMLASNIEKFFNDKTLLASYKNNALELTARQGDAKIVYDNLVQFIETVKN